MPRSHRRRPRAPELAPGLRVHRDHVCAVRKNQHVTAGKDRACAWLLRLDHPPGVCVPPGRGRHWQLARGRRRRFVDGGRLADHRRREHPARDNDHGDRHGRDDAHADHEPPLPRHRRQAATEEAGAPAGLLLPSPGLQLLQGLRFGVDDHHPHVTVRGDPLNPAAGDVEPSSCGRRSGARRRREIWVRGHTDRFPHARGIRNGHVTVERQADNRPGRYCVLPTHVASPRGSRPPFGGHAP